MRDVGSLIDTARLHQANKATFSIQLSQNFLENTQLRYTLLAAGSILQDKITGNELQKSYTTSYVNLTLNVYSGNTLMNSFHNFSWKAKTWIIGNEFITHSTITNSTLVTFLETKLVSSLILVLQVVGIAFISITITAVPFMLIRLVRRKI